MTVPDASWAEDAACLGMDTNFFYPEQATSEKTDARSICRTCDVRTECLDFALQVETPAGVYGTWGGTNQHQRRKLHAARRATA